MCLRLSARRFRRLTGIMDVLPIILIVCGDGWRLGFLRLRPASIIVVKIAYGAQVLAVGNKGIITEIVRIFLRKQGVGLPQQLVQILLTRVWIMHGAYLLTCVVWPPLYRKTPEK